MTTIITRLVTNAIGFPFFILHRAIKYRGQNGVDMVIHNTTGGVEILTYDSFMEGRKIINQRDYVANETFDPEAILLSETNEFDWMNYNCEDFVSKIIDTYTDESVPFSSIQRTFWISLTILLLILLIIIRYGKKK